MLKTTFKLAYHEIHPEKTCVEVWYGEQMIAAIYAADSSGIRVVSKYHNTIMAMDADQLGLSLTEIIFNLTT